MSRDPDGYQEDAGLYSMGGSSPLLNTDPTGLRPLQFSFRAFIHRRFGLWVPEPPPFGWLGYYFGTDMRGFGESGTSRLFSEGSIESTEIGNVSSAGVVTDTGWSHRRWRERNTWAYDARKAVPKSEDRLYNTYDMRTRPTSCETRVVVKASAAYPFIIFAPNIDYHIGFDFIVVAPNRVQIAVGGVHDAFPCYEALADGYLLYKHDTTWGGPGTGLTFGYLLGQSISFGQASVTVDAETPECCAIDY